MRHRNILTEKRLNMQKITNYRVIINDIELVLTTESWKSADADALVLSANNRLILRGATGLAGWLNQQCPNLHGRCAQLVQQHELRPMRGILPGYGAITEGPDGKMIIHAVTVDYDHSEFVGKSFSGMDTVAAATGYASEPRYCINLHPLHSHLCARVATPTTLCQEALHNIFYHKYRHR
jgi:hypothetical protein